MHRPRVRGPPAKRLRGTRPIAEPEGSPEEEDETEEAPTAIPPWRSEYDELREEHQALTAAHEALLAQVSELEQHHLALEGLKKAQLKNLTDQITNFNDRVPPAAPQVCSGPAAVKISAMYADTRSSLKKIIRESTRLYMFSSVGSMFAPMEKKALAGIFLIHFHLVCETIHRRSFVECGGCGHPIDQSY